MPCIVSTCQTYYKVKSGDSCYSIDLAAGITLAQFRSWNTQIDATCTNLWVDYYVCTKAEFPAQFFCSAQVMSIFESSSGLVLG
ncbi:hypothetical protein N7481_009733 [Penicillium waksmanii]|uniref:uncharacterized protein n=1 Tax=Penicillium waksmanii TaxID=69791 RepID=UPI0025471887|nr:uncharacterized protein N7481_009733 [Penicillium waksmanii]KAJ5976026.1 hypothetical protein N7481_009733 [Penicillium waksmanii]